MSQNLITLMTTAAELRTGGMSWEYVAREVNRKAGTCSKWPSRYRREWNRIYMDAQRQRYEEVSNESLTYLRSLLRSKDDKTKLKSIEMTLRYGPAAIAALTEGLGAKNPEDEDKYEKWLRYQAGEDDWRRRIDRERASKGLPPATDAEFYAEWTVKLEELQNPKILNLHFDADGCPIERPAGEPEYISKAEYDARREKERGANGNSIQPETEWERNTPAPAPPRSEGGSKIAHGMIAIGVLVLAGATLLALGLAQSPFAEATAHAAAEHDGGAGERQLQPFVAAPDRAAPTNRVKFSNSKESLQTARASSPMIGRSYPPLFRPNSPGGCLMSQHSRREFLSDVGRGMFIAGLGSGLAVDLGLSSARAAEEDAKRLTFGALEPLVGLMQDTPAAKLLPLLVKKIEDGTSLKDLVAAATFANARTFGGEDYIGFHTLMALAPSYNMSKDLPKERQAMPILKVLYRNTSRIQDKGGSKQEVLQPPPAPAKDSSAPLIDHVHKKDMNAAEAAFAARMAKSTDEAFNYLLEAVQDQPEVHRVVLPYRAYAMLEIVGKEHASTMLRQSVHYCVKNENPQWSAHYNGIRKALPKLLDQYKLPLAKQGNREADEAWLDKLSDAIFTAKPEAAAEAAAAALADGFDPTAIADAIALAANQLVLRDAGRPANQTSAGKGVGSVHGDSIGVHACDTANAWRNLARIGNARNQSACLIIGAWQVAHDRGERGGDFLNWKPRPWTEQLEGVKANDPKTLIAELEDAIKHNDQARACAVAGKCSTTDMNARTVFDLLLKYAISEEGALHAEKYYQTCTEEFKLARPKFRWRQVVALSRVTASEYGAPAPGYAEMCRLLKV